MFTEQQVRDAYADGNLHAAAERLKCSYRTLIKTMEALKIPRARPFISQLRDRAWMHEQIVVRGRTQKEIAAELGTSSGNVAYHVRRLDLYPKAANQSEASKRWFAKRYPNGRRGPQAANWRGGRRSTRGNKPGGYIRIYKPDHPAAVKGYVYEHRLVMEEKLGRYLEPGEVVDHIDRNRSNNEPENLQLYPSTSHHISDHFKARDQVCALRAELKELKAELARYKARFGELPDEY